MNQAKVRELIKFIQEKSENLSITDREFLVTISNMLYAFGVDRIQLEERYADLNHKDSNMVEAEYLANPDSVALAAILQAHAVLKWSENI